MFKPALLFLQESRKTIKSAEKVTVASTIVNNILVPATCTSETICMKTYFGSELFSLSIICSYADKKQSLMILEL